jgi:type II secretory pathway pseudopilin PulG
LIVVIVIIAIGITILIPVLNAGREKERRASCQKNVKEIGLAFANYASTHNSNFPPSASLASNGPGKPATVCGWSFLVMLLPYMERDALYKTLPQTGDPEDMTNPATAAAMNMSIREFLCPSNPNRHFQNPKTSPPSMAVTNYKAMGASTRNSLIMVVDPGSRVADILDGTSHTIITIETMDDVASRWTVGKEATLVGLPQKSSPTGATPQSPNNFFAPPGFQNGTWGDDSPVSKAGLRTFLSYDFSPNGADVGKYEDPGFAQTPPAYGPSSAHPDVVICGMGDGSTQATSKRTDAAMLFFLITKNNSDPYYIPIQ